MIPILINVVAWICLGLILTTALHAALVAAVVNLRRAEQEKPGAPEADKTPGVTWFRPLKSGVPRLEEKLAEFLAALRAGDQVIFGVDPDSPEREVCASLAASHGDQVEMVECVRGQAANPKISKLMQMAPRARHEHWIVVDAEALMDRARAETFRAEWAASGTDVLIAGYRMVGTKSVPQRLDAMSVLMTLWPGLEVVRMFGHFRFTLGACTALRRSDLEKLGGWSAVGDLLAEDHELGQRFATTGRSIRLSNMILPLDSDPMTWGDYWRHQVRVAVTYRTATPLGAAGLIFTRGLTASLLLLCLHPQVESFILFLIAWGVRVALSIRMARQLEILVPGLAWTVPVADVVETAAWLMSWMTNRVWWGGRQRVITFRGRLAA